MRTATRIAGLILIVVLGTSACRNSRSGTETGLAGTAATTPAGPFVILHADTRALPIRVELARTEAQRERGLMYRNHLDPEAGMLFVFDHDGPLTFWMKNTFIPLDMIFIDRDKKIVGIVDNAEPETETPRRVVGESRYVLEIGGGLSRRLGVSPGSIVDFQGVATDATTN
jgi:uncharacterized membrane protein (UPF0127 family)